MRLPRLFFLAALLLATANSLHADPIATIINNASQYSTTGNLATAMAMAKQQSKKGTGLGYRSTKIESKTFTGKFTMPKLSKKTKSNQIYGMAIFSDDGCKVTIDGNIIDDRAGVGQTLQKLDQSFHELPILLAPGKEVTITVEYTNINFTGKGDIDGVSLFIFLVPLDAHVTEVSFKQHATKGPVIVQSDDAVAYSAPHWVDKNGDGKIDKALGEHNYPVAFTRNTKPEIEAHFEIKNLPKGAVCKAQATGSDGVSIPATATDVPAGKPAVPAGNQITLPFTAAAKPWADTVKFYSTRPAGKSSTPFTPFTLEWELSINNGKSWFKVGKTMHTVYVTLNDPKTARRQETLFEIGCRNANGKATPDAVVGAIWGGFKGRVVSRVGEGPSDPPRDPKGMIYWKPDGTYPVDVPALLKGDPALLKISYGTCGTWQSFFMEVLKEQGIDTAVGVTIDAPVPIDKAKGYKTAVSDYEKQFLAGTRNHAYSTMTPPPLGTIPNKDDVRLEPISNNLNPFNHGIFFVKEWKFGTKTFFDLPVQLEKLSMPLSGGLIVIPFKILDSPPPDQLDSPAQGNTRPRAWFGNHAIVLYKNAKVDTYYDPSYGGAPFNAPKLKEKWEDHSIQAYGALFKVQKWNGTDWIDAGAMLWRERPHKKGTAECKFSAP